MWNCYRCAVSVVRPSATLLPKRSKSDVERWHLRRHAVIADAVLANNKGVQSMNALHVLGQRAHAAGVDTVPRHGQIQRHTHAKEAATRRGLYDGELYRLA